MEEYEIIMRAEFGSMPLSAYELLPPVEMMSMSAGMSGIPINHTPAPNNLNPWWYANPVPAPPLDPIDTSGMELTGGPIPPQSTPEPYPTLGYEPQLKFVWVEE